MFTANQGLRGGKTIELKKTVDAAIKNCPSVKNVFIYKRTENAFEVNKDRDVIIDDVSIWLIILLFKLRFRLEFRPFSIKKVINKYSSECQPEVMDSEDPLFMLYTSGSTGKPKGLIHSQAGYLLQAAVTHQVFYILYFLERF